MVLRGATSLLGASTFLGPNGTHFARARVFQGPKKSCFSAPTPSNAPRNDVAPLKTITYHAINGGDLVIILYKKRGGLFSGGGGLLVPSHAFITCSLKGPSSYITVDRRTIRKPLFRTYLAMILKILNTYLSVFNGVYNFVALHAQVGLTTNSFGGRQA